MQLTNCIRSKTINYNLEKLKEKRRGEEKHVLLRTVIVHNYRSNLPGRAEESETPSNDEWVGGI